MVPVAENSATGPFILLYGTADLEVPYTESLMMRDALIDTEDFFMLMLG